MKQCPFCNAKIEENARFCLYCMTSLDGKQKPKIPAQPNNWWKYILSALLLFVIVGVCFWIFPKTAPTNNIADFQTPTNTEKTVSQTASAETTVSSPSFVPSQSVVSSQNASSISGIGSALAPETSSVVSQEGINPSSVPLVGSGVVPPVSSPVHSTPTPSIPSYESPTASSLPSSSQSLPTTVTYTYRDAKYGDDFAVSTDTTNRIVITGVKTPSANGEYVIPQTIDGKQVLAVMSLAFCDAEINQTVKMVVIPPSVKTVNKNAFANCYNLTDVYLQGSSIYIDPYAFADSAKHNGTLTIHCSSSCNDRNFRYYKNTASSYGAVYQEWNG